MDIQMPEMSGLEATDFIVKSMAPEDRPYIVAVTANAMPGDRESCLEAGMNDYVAKPIREQDLHRVLSRMGAIVKSKSDKLVEGYIQCPDEIWNVASAIENVGGDESIIVEIIDVLLKTAPDMLSNIRQALTTGNSDEVKKAAHLFKGAVLTLGESKVANLARELNAEASAKDLKKCSALFDRVAKEFEPFKERLKVFADQRTGARSSSAA
jgi:CheY-like chemotaxis protein